MSRRSVCAAACGALALLLAAAEASPAQVFVGNGRGGFFWPGVSYPIGPSPVNSYYRPFIYNQAPTGYSGFTQYGMTTSTPIYYGAASMYYGGTSYSPGYSTGRLVSPPPGTGLRGGSDVTSAAYATPNYPVQSPDYNTIYPISPPLSAVTDNTARVEVRVPADARLTFDGQATAQTGSDRTFRSPPLEPGQDYVYEVQARWDAAGRPVDQTRKVTVHAGDHVVVNFNQATGSK